MLQQKNLIIVHAFDHSACAFVRQHAFIEGLRDPETFRAVVDYQTDLMESRGYWLESRIYRDKLLRVLLGDFLRIEG